ncbi:hypothetical protein IW146_006375, partial [Coemansia sp. RSA 922]
QKRPIDIARLDEHGRRVLDALAPVFLSYEDDYELKNNSVYYDVKANPSSHFLVFIRLCRYFEDRAQDEHAAQAQAGVARAETDTAFEAEMEAVAAVRATDTGRAQRDAQRLDAAQAEAALAPKGMSIFTSKRPTKVVRCARRLFRDISTSIRRSSRNYPFHRKLKLSAFINR